MGDTPIKKNAAKRMELTKLKAAAYDALREVEKVQIRIEEMMRPLQAELNEKRSVLMGINRELAILEKELNEKKADLVEELEE